MPRIHKHDIAQEQLRTAVALFLKKVDYSSVITLAGAASGILHTLVKRSGKETFLDYARRIHNELVGHTPTRSKYSNHINTKLGVIAHRHFFEGESNTVELDLEKQAYDALCRAIGDYILLNGQEEPFIKAFLLWSWKNKDGPLEMERFKKVSDRLKPK